MMFATRMQQCAWPPSCRDKGRMWRREGALCLSWRQQICLGFVRHDVALQPGQAQGPLIHPTLPLAPSSTPRCPLSLQKTTECSNPYRPRPDDVCHPNAVMRVAPVLVVSHAITCYNTRKSQGIEWEHPSCKARHRHRHQPHSTPPRSEKPLAGTTKSWTSIKARQVMNWPCARPSITCWRMGRARSAGRW